jgi:phosphoserine phosphatase RsbU/P
MEHEPAHVLLIEDNPGDADLVRLRLVEGKSNVQVNCVPRLSDALASLDVDTPSLVLLDLNLPDSHGAETFRRIRQKAPNVPVVILSGQDDEALAIKAVHMGSGLPGQVGCHRQTVGARLAVCGGAAGITARSRSYPQTAN